MSDSNRRSWLQLLTLLVTSGALLVAGYQVLDAKKTNDAWTTRWKDHVLPKLREETRKQLSHYLHRTTTYFDQVERLTDCRARLQDCTFYKNQVYHAYSDLLDAHASLFLQGDAYLDLSRFHAEINDLQHGLVTNQIDSRRILARIVDLRPHVQSLSRLMLQPGEGGTSESGANSEGADPAGAEEP